MIEKHILIEDIDPMLLYGVNNTNMQMLKALYPKLRIAARGNVIHVMGDELQMSAFEEIVEKLQKHIHKFNSLTEEEILQILNGEKTNREGVEGVNTSIALAVRAMKNKEIRKIILSRPAVEAGEKLGFLPGDMKDKIDPYLQPLYDALEDMIPTQKLREMMEQNIIQIAPLAFMRGRTLNDAVVILDEAQNTTSAQIKMFLTRMGINTKIIITGDMTQIDLPKGVRSGLREACSILKGIQGISFIEMNEKDIVRHKLVTRIVNAYNKYEAETEKGKEYIGNNKNEQI